MPPADPGFLFSPDLILLLGSVLLAATLSAGVGLALAVLLRRRSAPCRYALLLASLVVAVLSPMLAFVAQRARLSVVEVPRPAVAVAELPPVSPPADISPAAHRTINDTPPADAGPTAAALTPPRPAVRWWQWATPAVLAVWALGAVIGGGRLLLGVVRLRRFLRTLTPCTDLATVALARRSAALLGLRRLPALCESAQLPVPMVMGLRRPCVVLPQPLLARLDTPRLEAVLIHELAHVAHGDLWVGLFQRLAGALLWWCPSVHRLNRHIADLREEICDNYVLTAQGDGLSLAEVLMGLAAQRQRPAWMLSIGAMGVVDERPGLAGRIERLIHNRRSTMTRMNRIALLGTLGFTLCLGGTILATTIRAADTAADRPTPSADGVAKPDHAPPGDHAAQVDRLSQADFWQTLGGRAVADWKADQATLKAVAADAQATPASRLRAHRLLVELAGNLRVAPGIQPATATRSLAAAMAHLEANADDAEIRKFAAHRGFTHVSVARKDGDAANIWVLIESIELARRGGLNVAVDEATGKVVSVSHWGKAADVRAADFSIDLHLRIANGGDKTEIRTAVQGSFGDTIELADGKYNIRVTINPAPKNDAAAAEQRLVDVRVTEKASGSAIAMPRMVTVVGQAAQMRIGGEKLEFDLDVTVRPPPAAKPAEKPGAAIERPGAAIEEPGAAALHDPSAAFFAAFDADRDGQLSFAELDVATNRLAGVGGKFRGRFEPHRYTWLSAAAVRESARNFASCDQDGDGAISFAESQRQFPASARVGAGSPEFAAEAARYLQMFDENRDGRVTFEEVIVSPPGAPMALMTARFSQISDAEIDKVRREQAAGRP
jgi:beta-lactamase regulating signal transducer with metallopeptidase domain/Ca2+-binding EF-hand superfamily protein